MNLFVKLRQVLELGQPVQIGVVTAVHEGGGTVQLPGGGLLQVRGAAVLGRHVYVRDGVIEGEAPDLPTDAIEV